MSFQMTKEEIVRATSLLDAEDAVLFAQSNLGGGHWLTPEAIWSISLKGCGNRKCC